MSNFSHRFTGVFETGDRKQVIFATLTIWHLPLGIFDDYNGDGYLGETAGQQRSFSWLLLFWPRALGPSQLKWDRENNPGRRGGTAAVQFVFALSEQSRYARNSPFVRALHKDGIQI